MNKILREEMEYLIQCDDKAITPDVKDDVEMTLDYIDELENKINKAIEYISHEWFKREQIGISELSFSYTELQHILDILRGEDNEK